MIEELQDDTVFVMETTTEELMTIKPQARIANETNTVDLNHTSTTSTTSHGLLLSVLKVNFEL